MCECSGMLTGEVRKRGNDPGPLSGESLSHGPKLSPLGSPLRKTARRLAELESQLLETLPEEARQLFLHYQEAAGKIACADARDSFITGFRCGARFTYDAFLSEEGPGIQNI